MDFKLLFTVLNSQKWYNESEEIEILKGKYNKPKRPIELIEKAIRNYKNKQS